jgi:hypothetical protein
VDYNSFDELPAADGQDQEIIYMTTSNAWLDQWWLVKMGVVVSPAFVLSVVDFIAAVLRRKRRTCCGARQGIPEK